MGSIIDATILHHVCIVLISLWLLNCYDYSHPVAYLISLIYLHLVHEGYVSKLRKKLQFEEKRDANQRRVLLDSETVRWLNHALEKMWLVCMEEIVSQKILLPIAPWFLKKYKPWTAKDIEIQHFYLGRSPPMFTEIRVLQNSNSDDHLVLEIGMNFRTADDMSAILAVKLRKRLGFGMCAKLHLLGMHIEGKVLVGIKFLQGWPFISRLRVCFSSPPYFQMIVKPIFPHGLDVTEVPGISGWIDNLLALVFEQTLVEPNMLVVDVEKFVSPQSENWFSVDAKEPVAHAIVEVLEGVEMMPSDLNGLADPYVKGKLGPFRFRTKTQKKTLAPKWLEEFKIPICSWDSQNILHFEVLDKDHVFDDMMGDCRVNINELRDGQRHEIWLPLQNIKMGRLHIAVTVSEANGKCAEPLYSKEAPKRIRKRVSFEVDPALSCLDTESAQKILDDISPIDSLSPRTPEMSPKIADKFEPVDIEGQKDTGIWIQQPGSGVAQVWEPRKAKSRDNHTSQVKSMTVENDGSSSVESMGPIKHQSKHRVRRGLRKIGSMFQKEKGPLVEDKSSASESSPKAYVREIKATKTSVRLIIDDTQVLQSPVSPKDEKESLDANDLASPHGNGKNRAKGILKQAGKSARELKSVLSRKQSTKHNARPISLPDASDDDTSSSSTSPEEIGESGLHIHGSVVRSPSSVSASKSFKSKADTI